MSYHILHRALQALRSGSEEAREEPGRTGVQEASDPVRDAMADGFVVLTLRLREGVEARLGHESSTPLRKLTDNYAAWCRFVHQSTVRFMVNGEEINPDDTPETMGVTRELTIDVVRQKIEEGAGKAVEGGSGGVTPDIRPGHGRKRTRAGTEEEEAQAPRSETGASSPQSSEEAKGQRQRPKAAKAKAVVRPRGSVLLQLPFVNPRGSVRLKAD